MNICVFIRSTTFHNKSGGLETQNKVLVEGLVKRGHKVIVITTSINGREEFTEENGVFYYFIKAPSAVYSRTWWENSYKKFNDLRKKEKFNVLISQSSAGKAVFRKARNIVKITVNHGTSLGELKNRLKTLKTPRNFVRFFVKDIPMVISGYIDDLIIFRNSHKIVCVSRLLKRDLIKEFPFFRDKVVVINNGVDLKKFAPMSKPYKSKGGFVVLYVGRVDKEKGIEVLLEAVKILKLKIKKLNLSIVGGGPYLKNAKVLAQRLEVSDVVKFVGEVDNESIVKFYKSADIFVLPSLRQEGFPMVLAEAMGSGLPIVASRIGGIPSVIENKKTGILVEPQNKGSLTDTILYLYKNKEVRETLSTNAREKAKREFSQDVMVKRYLNLISQLTS